MDKIDILITGIDGQGVVLASDIIGEVSLASGYDVKKTDTLSMAQRGGSVVTHLRIAEEGSSPQIKEGEVDILLALEKLEAARWADYLKEGAVAIINNQAMPPLSANLGNEAYPSDDEIKQILGHRTDNIFFIDGTKLVAELGNPKILNIFMLGALSMFVPINPQLWNEAITQRLPAEILEINLTAFKQGRQALLHIISTTPPEEMEPLDERSEDCGCGCN